VLCVHLEGTIKQSEGTNEQVYMSEMHQMSVKSERFQRRMIQEAEANMLAFIKCQGITSTGERRKENMQI
jgi:hypothetical protein